jgi:hypothetical protein
MELYFNKQIDGCCKLNFSNRVLKSPKKIITNKPSHPQQLNFDKKK